ncbi:hypothetical protein niasHT_014567 [Heterodera trifolii]|uniref:B30.2/SPRY domain-containing protein n=1 Tax=Heterodera trifolii TaxID=157864 RepID=A0ABD2LHQ7_9BILA
MSSLTTCSSTEDEFSADVFGQGGNVNDAGTSSSFCDGNSRKTAIGDRRKIKELSILTVVNITVTVALISFITIENARINAELESLKNIETKLNELVEQQKKDQNFIAVLKDRFGNELLKAVHPDIRKNISENFSIPIENCWDANAIHNDLEIFGSESLKVHYKGDGSGRRSVFAKHPILFSESGIFYFEIKIKSCKNLCSIGFSTKAMPFDERVGQNSDSCAYESDGQFWTNGSSNIGMPNFSHGDFVGCGINLATRRVIFTKNGQPLDTTDLFLSPPFDFPLFPFVSLNDSGDFIETNFGPKFKFDPAKVQNNFPRENYWDANFCHENLEIIGNKSLTVHHTGYPGLRSVFAKYSILLNKPSSDFFYYEISFMKKDEKYRLFFGFAVKQQIKLGVEI